MRCPEVIGWPKSAAVLAIGDGCAWQRPHGAPPPRRLRRSPSPIVPAMLSDPGDVAPCSRVERIMEDQILEGQCAPRGRRTRVRRCAVLGFADATRCRS